jgi:diacylglycerol kinase
MIAAATVSIMKMLDVVGRTPFSTADLAPAVAVVAVPLLVLLVAGARWFRQARTGWLMIISAAVGLLAIMNVGISTTTDRLTVSSHDPIAQLAAGTGAALVLAAVVLGRRRPDRRHRTGTRSVHGAALG